MFETETETLESIKCLGVKSTLLNGHLFPNDFDVTALRWLQDNYEPTSNEIYVTTYPKTGTTLTMHICHAIMKCYYDKTKSADHAFYDNTDGHFTVSEWIDRVRSTSVSDFNAHIASTKNSIRFWKTHAQLSHFPTKRLPRKMIIVCRNPKDALVSFYHHHRSPVMNFTPKDRFDLFYAMYVAGASECNSYFEYYKAYWHFYTQSDGRDGRDGRDGSGTQIYWLNYEHLVASTASKTREIANLIAFIGVDDVVNGVEDMDTIMQLSSVQQMRKQYKGFPIKNFVRKGITGDWKHYLTRAQNEIIDTLIRVHFNGTQFKYFTDLQNGEAYLCHTYTDDKINSKL